MKCLICGEDSNASYCSEQCYQESLPTMNERCPHRDSDKCPRCKRRIECLENNQNHRIKRSEAIDKLKPGESVMVDNIEYRKYKQACVNCTHLEIRNKFYCIKLNIVIEGIQSVGCDGIPGEGDCETCRLKQHQIRYYCNSNEKFIKDILTDRSDCDFWDFNIAGHK